ncbi:hypothetical protein D6D08_09934 [Aureobasidium pullulans]|nr:hypothetical protein D6D08_09934 [Aureobasidium pullulans]
MVTHHKTFPPFIHAQSMLLHSDNDNMEPLANCLSLMYMIGGNLRGSRKLFWKNVSMECERLREEHAKLNAWELLASMQALSIYLLVRLQEGETDYNNYDYLMLTTVIVISKEFARTESACDVETAFSSHNLEMNWKAWVFLESRRRSDHQRPLQLFKTDIQRLAVIYRVVDMLVYFEPAGMCGLQKDLIIAPLPAKKQLWEADNKTLWEEEGKRDSTIQDSFALAANGELVKLDQGQLYCSNGELRYRPSTNNSPASSATNWECWCSGMDGLGGLVMLAASLIV